MQYTLHYAVYWMLQYEYQTGNDFLFHFQSTIYKNIVTKSNDFTKSFRWVQKLNFSAKIFKK